MCPCPPSPSFLLRIWVLFGSPASSSLLAVVASTFGGTAARSSSPTTRRARHNPICPVFPFRTSNTQRSKHGHARLTVLLPALLFCGFFTPACAAAAAPPMSSPSPSPLPRETDTPSSAAQLACLLSLKASLIDPFYNLASWNLSANADYCSWKGVTCSRNTSVVTALNLPNFALKGSIPSSIANLSSLHTLNLAFNQLTGNIPPELGSLSSLKVLQLRHNLLNGSIPDGLVNATSLRFLLLENNNLTGHIPTSISSLHNLIYFSFADNGLSGSIPLSITKLSKLSAFYGAHSGLSGPIPTNIGNLSRLVFLDLQGNLLTGDIPNTIGSLTYLKELQLSGNQLSGPLPSQLGLLVNLTVLDLSFNRINGSMPVELGRMSALQVLYLQQNRISGTISPSLGNLTMLKSLNLSYNNLSGQVPTNGVLGSFEAASFMGNAFLCGGTLVNLQCATPPAPVMAPTLPTSGDRTFNRQSSNRSSSKLSNKWKIVIGVVVPAICLTSAVVCMAFWVWWKRGRETVQVQNTTSPELVDGVGKAKMELFMRGIWFSYEEIVSHAGFYDTAHLVGKGRFALVYRSDLPDGRCMAVKVFKNPMSQSAFEKEIEGLELASHFYSLLPIKGYYSSPGEKVIFYDFMKKGTLYDMLHNNPDAPSLLDWSKRLDIATGVAQALAHLHKGSSIRVLHKDVKSSNVLLDDTMQPLLADYGLIGLASKSLVETPGYTPPELKLNKKYTEKTDVYSFGVVLLELLTGKKPVSYLGDRQLNLVTWALRLQRDGRGREVLSSNLAESCPYPDYSARALNLAVLCLSEQPAQRPSMSEIASILEGLGGNNSPMRSPGIQQDKPLLM